MTMHEKRKSVVFKGLLALALLLLIGFIWFKQPSKKLTLPPQPVVVQKPQLLEMADYINQTGNIVAFNSVDLVARIEGYLEDIQFKDGTFIKKGQPLFVIEPQPYLEKLNEAKATVAVQKAAQAYAQSEYARQKRMFKENATSQNNVEKWMAKSQEYEAEVAKAKANEVVAAINYSYTHVAAPFDGRIGRHLVDVGNLVGNGKATNLANIEQLDPVYVYFNVNELDLIKIREAAKANGFKPGDIHTIPVYVSLQNETTFSHEGHLDFANTSLDAAVGTLEFRGIIPNKDFALLPGQFARVRVAISKPTMRLTVPDTAILSDQRGSYLLIVDKDNRVVEKRVTLGALEGNQRAVLTGLDKNDQVIVDGLQNATPGQKVTLQNNKASA